MNKLANKSCIIELLGFLDFQQVQILLYRSSIQFRQKLIKKYKQLQSFCENEISTYNKVNLKLFLRLQDPSDLLFYVESYKRILDKVDLEGIVNLEISVDESREQNFKLFPTEVAQRLRIGSFKVTGDVVIYMLNTDRVYQMIRKLFGPIKNEPVIALKSCFYQIYKQLSFNKRISSLDLNCSQKICLSIECIRKIDNLNLIVDCFGYELKFENINKKYPSTNFKVTFLHSFYDSVQDFKKIYPELLRDRCSQICIYNERHLFSSQYQEAADIYQEIKEGYINCLVNYKLKQRIAWNQVSAEDYYGLLWLLYSIQVIHGDKFKIQYIEFLFHKHYDLQNDIQLIVENMYVNSEQVKFETLSMPLISKFRCTQRLEFFIKQNIQVLRCKEKFESPKIIKLKFENQGLNEQGINWETITFDILDSLQTSERITQIKINLTSCYGNIIIQSISSIFKIYKFVDDCPSLQKLHIPYTNDNLLLKHLTFPKNPIPDF